MSFDYSEVDLFSTQECLLNSWDCIRNTSWGIRKNVSKLLNNDLSLITHEEREAIREIIDKKFPLLAIPPVLKLLWVIWFSQTSQRYGKLQYNLNEYEVVRTVANCWPMRWKNLDAILLPDLLYEWDKRWILVPSNFKAERSEYRCRVLDPLRLVIFVVESTLVNLPRVASPRPKQGRQETDDTRLPRIVSSRDRAVVVWERKGQVVQGPIVLCRYRFQPHLRRPPRNAQRRANRTAKCAAYCGSGLSAMLFFTHFKTAIMPIFALLLL